MISVAVLANPGAGLVAQTTVTGRIFQVGDEDRGVGGARLQITSADSGVVRVTYTGTDGEYELTDLAPGPYELVISRIGYVPATFEMVIHRTEPVRLTIGLTPRPVALDPIEVEVESRLGAIAHLLPQRPTERRRVITRADIRERAAGAATAADVVQRLRPGWMHGRGDTSTRIGTEILVYVNNLRRGPLSALETVPSGLIYEIWLVSGLEATQRWGTGHAGGVIHILMLPPD